MNAFWLDHNFFVVVVLKQTSKEKNEDVYIGNHSKIWFLFFLYMLHNKGGFKKGMLNSQKAWYVTIKNYDPRLSFIQTSKEIEDVQKFSAPCPYIFCSLNMLKAASTFRNFFWDILVSINPHCIMKDFDKQNK